MCEADGTGLCQELCALKVAPDTSVTSHPKVVKYHYFKQKDIEENNFLLSYAAVKKRVRKEDKV